MRVFAAVVLASLASAAGAQAAMFPPPIPVGGLPQAKVKLERAKPHTSPVSCTAHTRAKIGKTQRRLVPVACEQPPRSKVFDNVTGLLLTP